VTIFDFAPTIASLLGVDLDGTDGRVISSLSGAARRAGAGE
jgi:hypothetical protein